MHRLNRLRISAFVTALALCGCPAGDDGESLGSGSSGDSSSGSTTTTATTMATTTSTSTSTTTTTSTSTSTSTSTESESGGGACGGVACAESEYCEWPVNDCGVTGSEPPQCTAIPDGCPGREDPVCGCDGVVYSGECSAAVIGVDVDEANGCIAPPDTFACGYKFCDPSTSYCQVSTSDVGGFPNGYGCVPLPEVCGDMPSCECLGAEVCFDSGCETTPEGGLVILCPGG